MVKKSFLDDTRLFPELETPIETPKVNEPPKKAPTKLETTKKKTVKNFL